MSTKSKRKIIANKWSKLLVSGYLKKDDTSSNLPVIPVVISDLILQLGLPVN